MVSQEGGEYLEVRLPGLTVVSGSRTQGRFGNGQGQEYAEEFMLDYWRPGFTKWRRWKDRSGKQVFFFLNLFLTKHIKQKFDSGSCYILVIYI
jgi:hypothetical protein